MDIFLYINALMAYGVKEGLLRKEDFIYAKNLLYDYLRVTPGEDEHAQAADGDIFTIMKGILDFCCETGVIPENTVTYRDMADARIMGMIMARPSEVTRQFWETYSIDKKKASDNFYRLNNACHYIQADRIAKNLYWKSKTEYGDIEITINLSKPEKDPKEIAAAKNAVQANYPKCLLCVENVGYAGTLNHPARQNLRVVPVTLNNEEWYFQYSPYVYYNEHCIVLNRNHIPMKISEDAFRRLLDFIEIFPHYFIGSNADLPIVGGSILTHDHYQGGRHVFPMEKAVSCADFSHNGYEGVTASLIKWPMSVIRLSGKDRETLIRASMHILNNWQDYSDLQNGIHAYTETSRGKKTSHNAITPIVRLNPETQCIEIDLVLRNNRTSTEHPLGIFHPHANLHHIKKENIGLIEVMGLAVLPGRLENEMDGVKRFLTSEADYKAAKETEHPLALHFDWLDGIFEKYDFNNGAFLSEEKADRIIKDEISLVFIQVLSDAGVFKKDKEGSEGIRRFMNSAGFELC